MKALTFEQVEPLFDKNYSLYYVDYRDSLDENLLVVQEAIHGNHEKLDSIFMDWDNWETMKEYKEQLKETIIHKLKVSEEVAEAFMEDFDDDIRDTIESKDDSTPLADLIRNTSKQVMFYDLCVDIDDYTSDLKGRIRAVKKALKIATKNTVHDKAISMMCQQASYGGKLVVYFYEELHWFLDENSIEKIKKIEFFGNVNIAIVDHHNGSGDSCEIFHDFSVPFNRENIFIDETIKYNYTFSVCGMVSNWCEGTKITISTKGSRSKAPTSKVGDHLKKEAELNATFKAGKCTAGDMDIKRHRKAHYINEFPCGNRCEDCNTFWID